MASLDEQIAAELAKISGGSAGVEKSAPIADQITAELERLNVGQTAPPVEAEGQNYWTAGASNMLNDINAGLGGVNPVSVAKAAGERMPAGRLMEDPDGNRYVDVDGERVDPALFKPSDYVMHNNPQDGGTYLYRKTPEMAESGLASAGRLLGYGVASGGVPLVRQAAQAAPATVSDAARLGIEPSLGMRGKLGALTAGAMESSIFTAGPIAKDSARAMGEISEAAGRIAQSAGPAEGRAAAGQALQGGVNYFVKKSGDYAGKLFGDMRKFIPPKTEVATTNTRAVLGEISSTYSGKPTMGKQAGAPEATDLIEELSQATTWQQLSQWRSRLMESTRKMDDRLVSIPDGDKKRIVAAITEDMGTAASKAGPDAEFAWRRAANFYKARGERIESALSKIMKSDTGEMAFDRLFAMSGEKGRSNIVGLRKIKGSLRNDEWGEVVSTVIDRMGKPPSSAADGAFSGAAFLTNWGKMAPEARMIMVDGKGLPAGLRSDLDALVRVLETSREASGQINRARSGTVVGNTASAAAMITNPGKTAAFGVVANLSARAVTNRNVIRALTVLAKTGNPSRLIRVAERNPQIAAEILTGLRLQGGQSSQ